jgi:NAD(P)H-dependent flavin oxidoreductase YrpB (nitropropane dioxygenase family)
VHSRDFAGSPAGQVLGSVDRVRPAKDVVRDMVEQWIDTTERLNSLMDD